MTGVILHLYRAARAPLYPARWSVRTKSGTDHVFRKEVIRGRSPDAARQYPFHASSSGIGHTKLEHFSDAYLQPLGRMVFLGFFGAPMSQKQPEAYRFFASGGLVIAVLACLSQEALADKPAPPKAYRTVVGQYTFVMLPGEKSSQTGQWQITKRLPSESGKDYPASGLYPNDGSITPYWTVEWYAFTTHLSRDGRYLVQMGPWPMDYSDLAVAFHDRGQLIKRYTIRELVRQPEGLPHSVSHFEWRRDNALLDDSTHTFTLKTLDGVLYVFDITSGTVIRSGQDMSPFLPVAIVFSLLIGGGLVAYLLQGARKSES